MGRAIELRKTENQDADSLPSFAIRKPGAGGGTLLCYLQLVCSAITMGTDGRVSIDFRAPDHGIFVGGVALLGDFI